MYSLRLRQDAAIEDTSDERRNSRNTSDWIREATRVLRYRLRKDVPDAAVAAAAVLCFPVAQGSKEAVLGSESNARTCS